jgi:hypothetical protein
MRRILAISSIGNQPHNLHGKYIPGAGVGASSVSTRRLKQHRSAECYVQPQITYIRVSDIATYDYGSNYWILNDDTVITPLQYLSIYINEELHIPYYRTFTNNGQIDVNGFMHLDNDSIEPSPNNIGAILYNTGAINNYGSIQIAVNAMFYTYDGGRVYNSTAISPSPIANIVNQGLFALPPNIGSTCGYGFFTGKSLNTTYNPITFICPL